MLNSDFDLIPGIIVGTADSKAEGVVMWLNRDLEELQSQLSPLPRTTSAPKGQVDVIRLAQNLASELSELVFAMSQEEFEDLAEEEENEEISSPEPSTDSSDPMITVAPSGVKGSGVCSS